VSACFPDSCAGAYAAALWSGAQPVILRPLRDCDASIRDADSPDLVLLSSVAYLRNGALYEPLLDGVIVSPGSGPLVIAKTEGTADAIKGQRVAIPGADSTEALLAETFLPGFTPVACDDPLAALHNDEVYAAVTDTMRREGMHTLVDLGERFAHYHPDVLLPLRLWCVRRDLAAARRAELVNTLRDTLARAQEDSPEAVDAAMRFARGADRESVAVFLRERFYISDGSGDNAMSRGLDVLREYSDADYYAANGRF